MRAIYILPLLLCAVLACDKPATKKRALTYHGLMGFVDAPVPGGSVGPVFLVAGWAIGRQPVDSVRIYIDDEIVGTATIMIPRPDVDREYPHLAGSGPNHGFTTTVDAGSRSGYHTVRIEAIDRTGARAHVASQNVNILQ
jgi:hypothetical protein